MTVQEFITALETVEDKSIPVIVVDTRSGVTEDPSVRGGKPSKWTEADNEYGMVMPVGSLYCPIYL